MLKHLLGPGEGRSRPFASKLERFKSNHRSASPGPGQYSTETVYPHPTDKVKGKSAFVSESDKIIVTKQPYPVMGPGPGAYNIKRAFQREENSKGESMKSKLRAKSSGERQPSPPKSLYEIEQSVFVRNKRAEEMKGFYSENIPLPNILTSSANKRGLAALRSKAKRDAGLNLDQNFGKYNIDNYYEASQRRKVHFDQEKAELANNARLLFSSKMLSHEDYLNIYSADEKMSGNQSKYINELKKKFRINEENQKRLKKPIEEDSIVKPRQGRQPTLYADDRQLTFDLKKEDTPGPGMYIQINKKGISKQYYH